jgi:hypothetical protein
VAIDAWLATSVDRTTIFAPVLACTSMATWAVVAAGALAAHPRGEPPPEVDGPPLDDRARGVLHHVP